MRATLPVASFVLASAVAGCNVTGDVRSVPFSGRPGVASNGTPPIHCKQSTPCKVNVNVPVNCTKVDCVELTTYHIVVQNGHKPTILFTITGGRFPQMGALDFHGKGGITCGPPDANGDNVTCTDAHPHDEVVKFDLKIQDVDGVIDPWVIND